MRLDIASMTRPPKCDACDREQAVVTIVNYATMSVRNLCQVHALVVFQGIVDDATERAPQLMAIVRDQAKRASAALLPPSIVVPGGGY